MHIIFYATTAQSRIQMVVKSNTVSLRHKHSPETLFIHINQCICIVLALSGIARQSIFHLKYCFQQNFIFENFIFLKILFFKNFIKFYFILFYFNKYFFFENFFYNEQCSFTDSGKIPSRKNRFENQVECTECTVLASPRAQSPGRAPAAQPTLPCVLRARPHLLPLTCRVRPCLPRPLRSARASHASASAPRAAAPRLPQALSAQRPSLLSRPARCALRAMPAPLRASHIVSWP